MEAIKMWKAVDDSQQQSFVFWEIHKLFLMNILAAFQDEFRSA